MGVAKTSFYHEDLENTLKQEATSSDEQMKSWKDCYRQDI